MLHKKLLCQTKQIFHIEVNVAQQNYVRQKNMLWQQKKLCDIQSKTHVDKICLVLQRKGVRVYKKWFLLHIHVC